MPSMPMPSAVDTRANGKAFPVLSEASDAGAPAPAAQATATAATQRTPLERLRAGEIDRDGYLDLKVDDATAHLQGLRPEELDTVKTVLRGQLESDPVLVDLVRQATRKAPATTE